MPNNLKEKKGLLILETELLSPHSLSSTKKLKYSIIWSLSIFKNNSKNQILINCVFK